MDDLIRIKSSAQEDDLIKILDEITIYEKLSVDEKLKDLKSSDVTRKKCPLLAAFTDGKIYETILAELAANVYLQVEGQIPDVLMAVVEISPKWQKQKEALQSGITRVEYRDLMEYCHETMKDSLAAVFTKRENNVSTAVIIVKEPNSYTMYHGNYMEINEKVTVANKAKPIVVRGKRGIFVMDNYSVLGNNGYRFARYTARDITYDVLIGPDDILYLVNKNNTLSHMISHEEKNAIAMAKKDPDMFADLVTSIIESVV